MCTQPIVHGSCDRSVGLILSVRPPATVAACNREAVETAKAGQSCSFALKKIKGSQIRKGMVMMHPSLEPVATWQFVAEIRILFHSTTIQVVNNPAAYPLRAWHCYLSHHQFPVLRYP